MARRGESDEDIIREARERFQRCETWEAEARAHALDDARFANGDSYNRWQWQDTVLATRGDRPSLTLNKTRQHNLHIINDALQHKAAVKVTPTGHGATFEAAQVFSAIIRRIEYQSKAMDAYSTAIYHQVESGMGYVRVTTDYADDESMDQEIFIKRVANPRDVYLDPDAVEYDKADMRFAFLFTDTPRKEFEAKFPDVDSHSSAPMDYSADWDSKDHVREAEYWRRGVKDDELHELHDGSVIRDSKLPSGVSKKDLPIKRSRKVAEPEIEWFQLAGSKIIDRKTWPGKYIPLVPFIGEEVVIHGKMDRKGHTRALIDPQKMYNYWNSSAVEHVALQGKSPFIAAAAAVEGRMNQWSTANTQNYSVLVYNAFDEMGRPVPPPERSQPPVMAQAYLQGMEVARKDMMEVSGQYQAEMGAPGNERSGVAIQQRQREGDTATYHYIEHQARGIRQIGRIVLNLIPKIYDVARVIKIMGEDGEQSDVHLDPSLPVAHQQVLPGQPGQPPTPVTTEQADAAQDDPNQPDPHTIFNPNVGLYDVEADVGPSFGTRREEAFNAFSEIMSQNKEAFAIVGDFWAQNADFPGADDLAERLKRGIPPQYKSGPDPQVQQLQAAMQQQGQQAHQLLAKADAEVAHLQAQIVILQEQAKEKSGRISVDDYRAETDRLAAVTAADPTVAKVLVRSMLSQLLGMPALPVMQEHDAADAAHAAKLAPMDPDAINAQAAQDQSATNGTGASPQPNGAAQ